MISTVLFVLGLVFIFIGIFGMYRFPTFHSRLMASTLIDTSGYICILIGIILRWDIHTISIKLLFLIFVIIVINPIFTHFLIQSSWKSGHKEKVKENNENANNPNNGS